MYSQILVPLDGSPRTLAQSVDAERVPVSEIEESHLRSSAEVTGYYIETRDGEIGHVDDFIIDLKDWSLGYLQVDTRNWWPGKKVLVSPSWIDESTGKTERCLSI